MAGSQIQVPRRLSLLPPTLSARFVCGLFLLSFLAICLDDLLAPALYNGSPLWATAAFLLLAYRSDSSPDIIFEFSWPRFVLFISAHAAIILFARYADTAINSAAMSDNLATASLAAAKFAVLIPVLLLLPLVTWRQGLKTYRAEAFAALVVLFTFFPYRLFHTTWPEVSQIVGKLTYYGACPFVPGIGYSGGPNPTITAPLLDLQIVFGCSGLSAIRLFDILIALIAFLDWNQLNRARLFTSYILGGAAILVANIFRIILLVIVGNRIAPKYAMGRFHLNAGWIFFAAIYFLILLVSYRWMLRRPAASTGS